MVQVPNLWFLRFVNMSLITIKNNQLIPYQELSEDDSNYVLEMRNHPDVRQWMFNKNKIELFEHKAFIKSLIHDDSKKFFLIKSGSHIIGTINFSNIDHEKRVSDFGIYANPFYKIKGRGKILISSACRYAKNEIFLKKLFLEVYKNNIPAIGLYKKYGFVKTNSFAIEGLKMLTMCKNLIDE